MNPNLPGVPPLKQVVLAEKIGAIWTTGMPYCWTKCVTHFGEDALPYHPGEKTCFDRCMHKLMEGVELARSARKVTEATAKDDGLGSWKWMQDLDVHYKNHPPKYV